MMDKTKLGFLAVDQYGDKISLLEKKFPRKQLLEHLGYKNASKMFIDDKKGRSKHIGYIVGHRWFNIYEVHQWEGVNNG
jgi:hypothetical protein